MILIKKITLITVGFLFTVISYGQKTDFSTVLEAFADDSFKEIDVELSKIDTNAISTYDKATWLYYKADYEFRLDNHHKAYKNAIYSKELFAQLDKGQDVSDCNILLLEIISHQNNLHINTTKISEELKTYALRENDTNALRDMYYRLAWRFRQSKDRKKEVTYYNKIKEIAILQKDTLRIGHCYANIGSTFDDESAIDIDSSMYYYQKAVPIFIKYNDTQSLSYNYNNIGNTYKKQGYYDKAIIYFKKALALPLKRNIPKSKVLYYENISDAYYKNKDYKNAAIYLNKKIKLQDSINDTEQNIAIAGIKEKYDNEKLRADNLEIEAEKNRNKNLLSIAVLLLFFGGITSLLMFQNSKRKRRIIQTEKLIEQQKVANLLKEQELVAIDAMILGQEKERQQIASDLHDDLGALMATLQFNFENLQKNKDNSNIGELFIQTKSLIKEAYQKMRSIASAKNSGTIANQGLLKAITNNADKISQLNNIDIEVRAHGLQNRLENSLELTIFRIVQELITNIVKHAEATHAIIHLTNHKDSLNIMVEDDGKGFDINQISKSDGMGIQSIEKRVEALEGTVVIESFINKGTTIIIDIPL